MSSGPADPARPFVTALDVSLDLPVASVGTRALAHLVDGAVVWLVGTVLLFLAVGFEALLPDAAKGVGAVVLIVGFFVIQWGYFPLFEALWDGQTPGKRLMGLRVVTDEGGPAGWGPVLLRNLVRIVDFLPMFYSVGVVVMLVSARSKRLGDLAGGTVVVREAPRRSAASYEWPAGLSGAEIALLESWFQREQSLSPDRREALAGRILERLGREHPDLITPELGPLAASDAIHRVFAPGRRS